MIFENLSDPRQYLDAIAMIESAKTNHYSLEIHKPRSMRTTKQASYYRVVLRYYASLIGLTETEAEYEFKVNCEANRETFTKEVTDKLGHVHKVIRSSADLTKDEMTSALNNFRAYAEINAGVTIPYESDYADIQAAKREIDKVRSYI